MGWQENTIKWLKVRAEDCEHKDKTWLGEDTPISSGYHNSITLIYELRATIDAGDAKIARLLKDNERAWRMYDAEREKVEHYYNHLCTRGFDEKYTMLPRSGHAVPVVDIEKLGELMDRADAAEARVKELENQDAHEGMKCYLENKRLERELADITHVAMTADPSGWWIAPRGSSDPSEWICVEEMLADLQCPECGYDSLEEQWVCRHCGYCAALEG